MNNIMGDYINFLGEKNPERFNEDMLNTKANDDLMMYIDAICQALTVIPGIEYLGSEKKINRKVYKSTPSKKEIDITDSVLDTITMKFKLSRQGEEEYITKDLYFPRLIDGQYFIINDNRYVPVFQMVDAGTFRNKDCLTLKTLLMPVKLRNNSGTITDMDGVSYTGNVYKLDMFKNKLNLFLYYMAKFGLEDTIDFFEMDAIYDTKPIEIEGEDVVNFQLGKENYIGFGREWINNPENRDILVTFISLFNTRSKVNDQEYWVKKLGSNFTKNTSQQVEKANGILLSLERILDGVTKQVLRTSDENKKDIYHILKWMTINYKLLSKQDTLHLDNKRLRLYEYILNPLLIRFSKSTYRLLNSRQITVHSLKTIFSNIHKGTLVKEIVKNELVRYKNSVNTYDLFTVFLKQTNSGPQTSFASGNVNIKFRDIQLSMVDRIDLCSTANGDPGSNGTITPFCILHKNMHFSEAPTYAQSEEDVEQIDIND